MATGVSMADIDFDEAGDPLPETKLMVLRDTTHAFHKLGNIGRPESSRIEFIQVWAEKPDFLVGRFIEGFGFFDVHFPRAACAKPTKKEKEWLEGARTEISPFPGRGLPKRGSL